MFFPKPTPISKILSKPGEIHSPIIEHLKEQNRLLVNVRKAVPSFLREHCLSCITNGNNLTLFTDSPAWAHQLRFHCSLITDELNRLLPSNHITKVKLRVVIPPTKPVTNKGQHLQFPSTETIDTIRNSANSISNIELKNALARLARTLKAKHSNRF